MDTSEVGELESCHLLGEYAVTREFVCLSSSDKLNYSINVHDEGNTLEVVGVCCKLYMINLHLSLINYAYAQTIDGIIEVIVHLFKKQAHDFVSSSVGTRPLL